MMVTILDFKPKEKTNIKCNALELNNNEIY